MELRLLEGYPSITPNTALLGKHGWSATWEHVVVKATLLWRKTMGIELYRIVYWIGKYAIVLSASSLSETWYSIRYESPVI